jgi:hypothetical protein
MEMAAQSRVHGGRICIAVRANAGAENAEDGFKRSVVRGHAEVVWHERMGGGPDLSERLLDVRHGRPPELDAGVPPWLELSLHMANRPASDTQSRDDRARGIDCPSRFRRASTSRRLIDAAAMT